MVELRRVVVTGIGVVSPIGNNQKEVRDSLFYNKSGISFSKDYYDLGFRSHIHGDINIQKQQQTHVKLYKLLRTSLT